MVEAKKDVKAAAKQAEETLRPAAAKAEAKPAAAVKEEAKAAPAAPASDVVVKETKAPAKKAAAKKEPAKKEPVKKESAKKAASAAKTAAAPAAKKAAAPTAKKETEKKAPAKTAAAKKPAAKKAEPKAEVHFQFEGKDLVAKDVLDQAVKAFKSTHRGVEIKTIELYIVANEGAAYYVVNGDANEDYKIML